MLVASASVLAPHTVAVEGVWVFAIRNQAGWYIGTADSGEMHSGQSLLLCLTFLVFDRSERCRDGGSGSQLSELH